MATARCIRVYPYLADAGEMPYHDMQCREFGTANVTRSTRLTKVAGNRAHRWVWQSMGWSVK